MSTEEYLLSRFGPLMSLANIAELLNRSADGLRVSLYSDTDLSRKLKPTMIRIGRRLYFRTLQVQDVLELSSAASAIRA